MDPGIDKECQALVDAINLLPGMHTTESCCGHGEYPFRIWFRPEHPNHMLPLLYYINSCHIGFKGWRVEVYTDCAMSHVIWLLEGTIGSNSYKQANEIAEALRKEVLNSEEVSVL